MKLHTYLKYGGNCAQAFRFYEKHLGGKITMMMTQGQQPNPKDVPSDQKNAILYARMSIGDTDLMGSDVPSERFSAHAQCLSLPLCEHQRRS
jgi:PhnB protein